MRLRSAVLVAAAALLVVACGFGVDLDNLFDGAAPATDGGGDGSLLGDGAPAVDAAIPKVRVTALQGGSDFACALRVDGTVMCWGYNDSYGQLGNGAQTSSSVPVLVNGLKDATNLSVGPDFACVVHATGAVSCWGDNSARQLGDGTKNSSPTPVNVVQLSDATALAVGSTFSCAIRKDGTVSCWGDDTAGQLGDGMQTARSQPAPVMGVANALQIAAASGTACALVKGGDVYCWGDNGYGQAGSAMPAQVLTPAKVAGLSGIQAIGAGSNAGHFCAVDGMGGLLCWGHGTSGQLGNGSGNNSATPVRVTSINDAVGVTASSASTCTWRKSGAVSCWGDNGWRELGVGDMAPPDQASTPLPVTGITNALTAGGGDSFFCAVLGAGDQISCWGENNNGALGRGTRINSAVPVPALTPGKSTAVAAGYQHACAVSAAGGLACWGRNDTRQLGSSTILGSGTPIPVPGLTGVTAAAGGDQHTCVLTGTQVQCFGHAEYGEMGNGMAPYIQSTPVAFGAGPATAVGAGYNYSCALLSNGQIDCSGLDYNAQLGSTNGEQHSPVPVLAPQAPFDAGPDASPDAGPPPPSPYGPVTTMFIGRSHSCALHGAGIVACWGDSGAGQCGVSSGNGAQPNPLDVTLPLPATAIGVGGAHTCVVLNDGSVRCFGANGHGQLGGAGGDGTSLRTPNLGGKKATALAAGDEHTCALLSDGTVSCWGAGSIGEIGNGVFSDTPTPAPVSGLTSVTALTANEHFACALSMDGSVACWGNNEAAQLGDGTPLSAGTPAPVAGY